MGDISKDKSQCSEFQNPNKSASLEEWGTYYDRFTPEQAADYMTCSLDSLTRISLNDLPRYKSPGRSYVYLRDDLNTYLKRNQVTSRRSSGLSSKNAKASASSKVFDIDVARQELRSKSGGRQ